MVDLIILFFPLMVYGFCWFLGGYYVGEGSWLKEKEGNEG